MAIPFYDVSVGSYLQILNAVTGFVEQGREYFEQNGSDPNAIVEHRLREDMLPFRFQLISVAHHSLGAMRGIEAGEFRPPPKLDLDYAGLQDLLNESREGLEAYGPDAVEALQGKPMIFYLGDREIPFLAEDFVLTFSLPNFYFHAATAYDILRMQGVPLGKKHFLGRMRLNR